PIAKNSDELTRIVFSFTSNSLISLCLNQCNRPFPSVKPTRIRVGWRAAPKSHKAAPVVQGSSTQSDSIQPNPTLKRMFFLFFFLAEMVYKPAPDSRWVAPWSLEFGASLELGDWDLELPR